MGNRHVALIVEDHQLTALEFKRVLESLGCDSVIYDNKAQALDALRTQQFCVVLLDLGIRAVPGSMESHEEYGRSLLRELREIHTAHNGKCHLLPVVIVSGIDWTVEEAFAITRDGANDAVPEDGMNSRGLSMVVRDLFARSGRSSHEACASLGQGAKTGSATRHTLSIPGDQVVRRVRVVVDDRETTLREKTLTTLLRLMAAKGEWVHRSDLGAIEGNGFKGISELKNDLKPALSTLEGFVDNDYHSSYRLNPSVIVGEVNAKALGELHNQVISDLARKLQPSKGRERA
jgi:DNA-binding response OmpR family regulator